MEKQGKREDPGEAIMAMMGDGRLAEMRPDIPSPIREEPMSFWARLRLRISTWLRW